MTKAIDVLKNLKELQKLMNSISMQKCTQQSLSNLKGTF